MRAVFCLSSIALAWVGCANPDTNEPMPLTAPVTVTLAMDHAFDGKVTFTVAGGFAEAQEAQQETIPIGQPLLSVHTRDGRAMLDELRLPLGDIDVPAQALPPHGLRLRNLTLSAASTQAQTMHAEADALEFDQSLPLQLDWSMLLEDGELYPLGAVRTTPVELAVRVFRGDKKVVATVDARCDGTCWAIPGVVRLSDGSMHLAADANLSEAP